MTRHGGDEREDERKRYRDSKGEGEEDGEEDETYCQLQGRSCQQSQRV